MRTNTFNNYPYICFCCGKPLINAEYSYSGAVLCYDHYVKLNELSNGIKREETDHSNYEKHTQF